jgi:DNA polymerase-3 subunit chi
MPEIRFYHVQKLEKDAAIPALVSKAYDSGYRIVVLTESEQQTKKINELLWTWKDDSFLPHGTDKDEKPEDHPIWISSKNKNPNNATMVLLTAPALETSLDDYELCCIMIDGQKPDDIEKGRIKWKELKEKGASLSYWQQENTGTWKKSN